MVTGAGALHLRLLAYVNTFGNGAHEMAAYRKELVHSVGSELMRKDRSSTGGGGRPALRGLPQPLQGACLAAAEV